VTEKRVRVRDPDRRERILAAAAELFSQRGYPAVALSEIGMEAGIVGSGIYRHFESKAAILASMFDQAIDRLVVDAERSEGAGDAPLDQLRALVTAQAVATIDDRRLFQVYIAESRHLDPADLRRLREKQRHYVDLWQMPLARARPELRATEVQVLVQMTINAIHAVLRFRPAMSDDELLRVLVGTGLRTLGVA
jgi:AcrR family transcriptional regulator